MPIETAAIADHNIKVNTREQGGDLFIFFPADTIPDDVKASNPLWESGGTIRSGIRTLGYRGGYLRRCEITQMREAMWSENAANILPTERSKLTSTYVETVGAHQRVIGVTKKGNHDGLLRSRVYPSNEIATLTGKIDGIVQMPITTVEQAVEAQYFLFPNWEKIVTGATEIPRKTSQLLAHFMERKQKAISPFQRAVAEAAIKSVTDFKVWGTAAVKKANATLNLAKTKGWDWSYGTDAEMAFEQLELQRSDTMVQEQASKIDRLADAMTTFVEASVKQPQAVLQQTPDPDYAEFLEWKKARAAALETAIEELATQQCKATATTTGEQCKGIALENGYCRNASHQAQAVEKNQ